MVYGNLRRIYISAGNNFFFYRFIYLSIIHRFTAILLSVLVLSFIAVNIGVVTIIIDIMIIMALLSTLMGKGKYKRIFSKIYITFIEIERSSNGD